MIGKTLNDRYTIEERVGGGGMANVYKAHDNRLGREVAIKILRQEFVDDEEFVENFRKESHSAARLNHPNIVSVFDVGIDEIDGQRHYYIVMEIVNGKTLKDIINEKGRLNLSETLNYAIQISEALLCAHENGTIHRDIKPQNIIINRENLPKVTDFGIAQGANKHTTTERDIMGSVHYFSPEQARGEKTDERSDIYSLGIVMFEMLTGELPFDGENPISIALKQVHEKIRIPSSLNSDIPKQMDAIIMKMTNKEPSSRYNNFVEVIDDLKSLEKMTDLEMSDTLVIPITKSRKENPVSVDDQRRIRRTGIESSSQSRSEYKSTSKPSKGGVMPILGGIITALIVTSLLFFVFTRFLSSGGSGAADIPVPNIIGIQEDEARKIVEDKGLKFEVTERLINHDFEPNDVIHQSEEPGTMVKKGFTLRVTVNLGGSKSIEVKNYEGLDLEEALIRIKEDGLISDIKFEDVEDRNDYNKVINQDLRRGLSVEEGSTIVITVGREMDVELVSMPDLLEKPIDEAIAEIEELGLKIGQITIAESTRLNPDRVMGQTFEPGEELEIGTVINLVKSVRPAPVEEPEEEEELPPITTTPPVETPVPPVEEPTPPSGGGTVSLGIEYEIPDSKESANITIRRIDGNTITEVYNSTHYSSEGKGTITVTGNEDSVFQVFVDGLLEKTAP